MIFQQLRIFKFAVGLNFFRLSILYEYSVGQPGFYNVKKLFANQKRKEDILITTLSEIERSKHQTSEVSSDLIFMQMSTRAVLNKEHQKRSSTFQNYFINFLIE